jgi:recombination protein RecT
MADTTAVRNKLATRNDTAPATTQQASTAAVVREAIERQAGAFAQVLPSVVDAGRFSRLVLTAIKSTPDLMRCFATTQGETSVLLAAMQCAALGLEPNTPTQEAWLLPRRNHDVWECQLSIGYRGLLKLARRSGTIKTIFAEVVRANDTFSWSRGLEADELTHIPADEDRGELRYAYAVARYRDGGYSFEVLSKHQVEARRAMSDSWKSASARPYSPWTKWTEQMWRKSAIRALVPYLDLSPEAERALATDERTLALTDDGVIDTAPTTAPQGPPEASEDDPPGDRAGMSGDPPAEPGPVPSPNTTEGAA